MSGLVYIVESEDNNMRFLMGNTVYDALDVYIKKQYGDSSIPDSIIVYATCYNRVAEGFREFKLGSFQVNGDKEVYDDCMTKYKEMIAARMLRDGYCVFEFLGKYWTSYMNW